MSEDRLVKWVLRVRKAAVDQGGQEELVLPNKSSSRAVGFRPGGQVADWSQPGCLASQAVIKDQYLSNNWTQILDVRLMRNDRTWMIVLIGLKKFRQEILRAVMKYVAQRGRREQGRRIACVFGNCCSHR